MIERDVWQKPTSRRYVLKGVGLGAATMAAASVGGLINDINPRIESAGDINSITPIYGHHAVGVDGFEKSREFQDTIKTTGILPEGYFWPGSVASEVRRILPDILAIDGLTYTQLEPENIDEAYKDLWRLSPGNPFHINNNGLRIIAADLPFGLLAGYEKYPNLYLSKKVPFETTTALDAVKAHYETITESKVSDDINMLVHPKDIGKFYDYELYEGGVSNFLLGLGPLAYLVGESAVRKKHISRRKALGLGALSMLGFGNTARIYGDYIQSSSDGLHNPLYAPISAVGMIAESFDKKLPYVELRNALIKIKLEDSQEYLGLTQVKKAAVVGTAHQFGRPVWYSDTQAEDVVSEMLRGIFGSLEKKNAHGYFEHNTIDSISEFLGGVRVFKIGQEPQTHTIEDIQQAIQIETSFVSPTIKNLVNVAASEAGFGYPIK